MKTKSHILIACHSPGDVVGGQWQLLAFHFAFSFSKEVALPTPPASGLEKKDHVEVSYYLAHPLPQLNLQFKRSLKIQDYSDFYLPQKYPEILVLPLGIYLLPCIGNMDTIAATGCGWSQGGTV